jgi:leucyl-tRNA synthetase
MLSSKGLITKGVHPIGWCPSCKNPVGQHDTLHDMEPEVGEFTAIKFSLDGASLPAATLRPETIFGVTNLWVNPEAQYVEVEAKGERLIVSERAASKLNDQLAGVTSIATMKGSSLIGRFAVNPVNGKRILILPAKFVDPDNATGVVMSVPAHAPYDILAIRDLQNRPDTISKFGLDAGMVKDLAPIPVVRMEGASDIPARDLIDRMAIKDQLDPRAEDATKELYQREFHTAQMRPETGRYSGLPVSKAKDMVKADLIAGGKAFVFYEVINGPIYCRCGSEVTVNLLSDQWFINYGDEGWKNLVRGHLNEMSLLPEDLRQEFVNVVEWLREKACARRSGLGTRLPWDKDWIIESLSDSTIYMAFYTLSRIIRDEKIDPARLDDALFSYVFLGEGDPSSLKVGRSVAEAMRSEFLYFYPLDSRHSGRDLVPNHLTFFIFNHLAIFPKDLWPRQIAVNGSVLMEGKKMSKSIGNIIPLRKAITIYGADTLRMSILSASELLQDADFSDALARSVRSKLQEFYCFAAQYADAKGLEQGSSDGIDRWLLSRVQRTVEQTTCSMDCLRAREAIQTSFYSLQQDILWYIKRKGSHIGEPSARSVVRYAIEAIVKMIGPFAPHICEEIWEMLGGDGFISTESWPAVDSSFIDDPAELSEEYLKGVVADSTEIAKVTGLVPSKICFYTSPEWKWEVHLKLLDLLEHGVDPKALIKEAMKDPSVRGRGGEAAKFISSISQCAVSMPRENRQRLLASKGVNELACLKAATEFLSGYFKCEVEVYTADSPSYDPKKKAGAAAPLRPAIFIEGYKCSD